MDRKKSYRLGKQATGLFKMEQNKTFAVIGVGDKWKKGKGSRQKQNRRCDA